MLSLMTVQLKPGGHSQAAARGAAAHAEPGGDRGWSSGKPGQPAFVGQTTGSVGARGGAGAGGRECRQRRAPDVDEHKSLKA